MSRLTFDDVVVRYPDARANAVEGVSFTAAAGAVTALVGPNGSGKSSCVRALLGRAPVVRGRLLVGGADVVAMAPAARARAVAVVPQREQPIFPMPVPAFVALGRYAWHESAAHTDAVVAEAMARADATPFAARETDTLSGGEWQRVRMARALAQGAPALVLDEPTAFLDIAHEMAVFELLRSLANDGRTVLVVSHQLNLVARFADHVVLLHNGRVAADGPPGTVMDGVTLERVYGWPLVVSRDPAVGAPTLVPLRAPGRRPAP
jgi:iron complex transport system ATP-binding protein